MTKKKDRTKFYRTDAFRALQQSYYSILAEEGFSDIEWHHKSPKSGRKAQNISNIPPQQVSNNQKQELIQGIENAKLPEEQNYAPNTGFGSRFLKGDNARIYNKLRIMSPERLYEFTQQSYDHYHAVTNFLTHVKLDDDIFVLMLELYSEGATYRQITKALKEFVCKYPKDKKSVYYSIFWVHTRVTELLKEIMLWNRQHPKGLFKVEPIIDEDDFEH